MGRTTALPAKRAVNLNRVARPRRRRSRNVTRTLYVHGDFATSAASQVVGAPVSWTVIGADRRPVAAIESYLAWLSDIERSPNTVRAYASDLKAYWTFLEARGASWERPSLELMGEFTAWLRRPADNVVVLPTAPAYRTAKTVNRRTALKRRRFGNNVRHVTATARSV